MPDLAIADFPVEWTPLPHMLLPGEASAEGAVLIHDNRPGNVLVSGFVERGDPEQGVG